MDGAGATNRCFRMTQQYARKMEMRVTVSTETQKAIFAVADMDDTPPPTL